MKYKQKVDLGVSFVSLLLGVCLLILPLFNIDSVKNLTIIIYSVLAIVNIIGFILNRESKDYQGLHVCLVSILALILTIVLDISSTKNLYIVLMTWVGLISLTKLKKMDYYHDRKNEMWKLQGFCFGTFILLGLLTCINLAHSSDVQMVILGYFFMGYGILECIDPIVLSVTNEKKNGFLKEVIDKMKK